MNVTPGRKTKTQGVPLANRPGVLFRWWCQLAHDKRIRAKSFFHLDPVKVELHCDKCGCIHIKTFPRKRKHQH